MPDTAELPDTDASIRRQVHLVAFLDAEGGVETWLVDDRGRAAHRSRGMRIRLGSLDRLCLALLAAPHLHPAQVEPFIAGEAVDHRRRLARPRQAIGLKGDREPGVVADVLSQRQL